MDRDRFMSPDEAKDFGLIDTILEHPPKFGETSEDSDSDSERSVRSPVRDDPEPALGGAPARRWCPVNLF